jgi:hypothetical protein
MKFSNLKRYGCELMRIMVKKNTIRPVLRTANRGFFLISSNYFEQVSITI